MKVGDRVEFVKEVFSSHKLTFPVGTVGVIHRLHFGLTYIDCKGVSVCTRRDQFILLEGKNE